MADHRVRCTSCQRVLDHTVPRTVDHGRVVRCVHCPPRQYKLSENDRKLLREFRIKVD